MHKVNIHFVNRYWYTYNNILRIKHCINLYYIIMFTDTVLVTTINIPSLF